MTQTKEERAEYHKKWYQAHKKEQQARSKAYRKLHIEERRAYERAYFDSHEKERKLYREKPEIKKRMKVYSQEWREANKEHLKSEIKKKYSTDSRYQKMRLVHKETQIAIRKGDLIKTPCEVCGIEKVEAHHPDYNRPLKVMWLCKKHHVEWHKVNKPIY